MLIYVFFILAAKQCKITNDNNGTTEEWYIDVFDTICAEKCVSDIWQLPEYQCDNELVCCSNPVARGSDDDVGEDVVDEVADDVADDDN